MSNLFERPFTWENKEHFIAQLPHKAQVKFALFCANQVKHLMTDKRSLKVLEVVQAFLDGKATKEDCKKAANAAYAANAVANAAANAAAYATANAATYAAAYAATYAAAYAAVASTQKEPIKQEQMNLLRELIVENLSEEERECWLLVASF